LFILWCCSNTFLAGFFRRLCAAIFVILHCLVYCYVCSRVLLLCSHVLLCLPACSVIVCFRILFFCVLMFCHVGSRVLLFLLSCSVMFAPVFCYNQESVNLQDFLFNEHSKTDADLSTEHLCFLQDIFGSTFTEHLRDCLENTCGFFTEDLWVLYRTLVHFLQSTWTEFYKTNVLVAYKFHAFSVQNPHIFCKNIRRC